MAIEYKVISRKVIGGPDKGQTKFYASANNTGTAKEQDMIDYVSKVSTASGGDVKVVLYTLEEAIATFLKTGNTVELGDLGHFRISLSSEGEDTADEVDANSIKGAKIIFTPSKKFSGVLDELSYKKI